jgi:hypothetical protein
LPEDLLEICAVYTIAIWERARGRKKQANVENNKRREGERERDRERGIVGTLFQYTI